MRKLIALTVVAVAVCQALISNAFYHAGYSRGYDVAAKYLADSVQEQIAQGIADAQHVAKIREASEYRRGFAACQEQF